MSFFYHPEIENKEEYQRRLGDLERFCKEKTIKLINNDYRPEEFENIVEPFRDKESIKFISDKDRYRRRRCHLCNSLLIQKTVEETRKHRIKYFTSTLLCSPYKDHDLIVEISNEKALDYHLDFYYQDFRKGYWMGRNYARNHQVHIPRFCGCLDSTKEERLE